MKPFVLGIAGGSASGKSTFTSALVTALNTQRPALTVETLGMDRYFYRGAPGPTFTSPSSGEVMPNNNHPDSADNARLVADLDHRLTSGNAADIVIVEGLMALHVPEIRDRLHLRLFIELEADVRALRRMIRDMNGGRGNRDPQFIATYYLECARIGHDLFVEPSRTFADLIIRGDGEFARLAPMVSSLILAQVAP